MNKAPQTLLEPKISGTHKKSGTGFLDLLHTPKKHKHNTTPYLPDNHFRKCYRAAPSPMTEVGHYTAKNHATKNVIELKWAPGPRAQCGQTPWGSVTV